MSERTLRGMAAWPGVAFGPAIVTAGSPGISRMKQNTTTLLKNSTGSACRSRPPTYDSIGRIRLRSASSAPPYDEKSVAAKCGTWSTGCR